MTAKWGSCVILALGLGILGGCKTPQPNLKPAKSAEQMVSPPAGTRYDTAGMPKQAFDPPVDPGFKAMDDKNGIMPTRGGGMPSAGGAGRY